MRNNGKISKWVRGNGVFSIFFIAMAVYYAIHMFTLKPWYDELYTYYSFISRGPVYAAIHWPVPNNHVLYSVLSAFLDICGNPYIGLRGISYLMALLNLWLVYFLAGKFMNRYFAAGASFLYASTYLVNSLSIQGRGYTLATACYLMALLALYNICMDGSRKRDYIVYALCLIAGLYTLVSSTFWVLPVCFIGGLFLLMQKQYKRLGKLIGTSIAAAFMTLFLYGVIWLAIGSNLLSKNAESIYFGIYQVTIILQNPIAALTTGMNYMLATPYVQSIGRGQVVRELFYYLRDLFNLYVQGRGVWMNVLLTVSAIAFTVSSWKNRKHADAGFFASLYLSVSILCLPLMLMIQSVQPYKRVFSFFAAVTSILTVYILTQAVSLLKQAEWKLRIERLLQVTLLFFAVVLLGSPAYNEPYADRENRIAEIIQPQDVADILKIYYTDDYQKYVLKFYYDAEPQETSIEEADTILIAEELMTPSATPLQWPILVSYDSLDWNYIQENFKIKRETDSYTLFQRME